MTKRFYQQEIIAIQDQSNKGIVSRVLLGNNTLFLLHGTNIITDDYRPGDTSNGSLELFRVVSEILKILL